MDTNKNQLRQKGTLDKISRKEAIKKVGITALATSSLIFLQTKASACGSSCGGSRNHTPGSQTGRGLQGNSQEFCNGNGNGKKMDATAEKLHPGKKRETSRKRRK